MTIIQEFQKKAREKNRVLESARKLSVRDYIIVFFFYKELFRIKEMYLKEKKKSQKKIQKNN